MKITYYRIFTSYHFFEWLHIGFVEWCYNEFLTHKKYHKSSVVSFRILLYTHTMSKKESLYKKAHYVLKSRSYWYIIHSIFSYAMSVGCKPNITNWKYPFQALFPSYNEPILCVSSISVSFSRTNALIADPTNTKDVHCKYNHNMNEFDFSTSLAMNYICYWQDWGCLCFHFPSLGCFGI